MFPLPTLSEFLYNTAALLTLTVLYSFLLPSLTHLAPLKRQIVQGVLFGLIACFGMVTAGYIMDGFLTDVRTIIVVLAGVFGGGIPALIASVFVIVGRIMMVGAGTGVAIASTLTAALIGIFCYQHGKHNPLASKARGLLLLGFIVAIQRLGWIFLLGGEHITLLLHHMTLPVLLVYPSGMLLLGGLLRWREYSFITDQKLRESEGHFRRLAEASFEGIAILDQGVILETNSAFATMLGYTPEELIGKRVEEIAAPESIEDALKHIQQGYEKPYESVVRRKDGSRLAVEVCDKQTLYQGKIHRVTALRDITERKQAQAALERERDTLRTLIDHLPDYIFIKDVEGRFILSNVAHARAVQAEPEALVGKTARDFFPPELAAQYDADDRAIMTSREALINLERVTVKSDGSQRIVLTTKVPLIDRTDECIGLVGISRDITKRKRTENTLQEKQHFIERVMSTTPDLVYVYDVLERRLIYMNHNLFTSLGHRAEDFEDVTFNQLVNILHPEDTAHFYEETRKVVRANDHEPVEVRFRLRDIVGNWHWFQQTCLVFLRTEQGDIRQLMGIVHDITAQKEVEEKTMRLAIEHERVKALQGFIRDISHDLRTPLTIIGTSTYFLEKLTDGEKRQERLNTINAQVHHLTQTLDSIYRMSRLESEAENFDFKPVDVNLLVQRVVAEQQSSAVLKQQKLTFFPEINLPSVKADEVALKQSLEQLVRNSFLYTDELGEITLSTQYEGQNVMIEVQDNGIGISQNDLGLIFDHFYRASDARPMHVGSAGLGLPIARKIVDAHGGRIEVKSQLGQGSVFRIILPAG